MADPLPSGATASPAPSAASPPVSAAPSDRDAHLARIAATFSNSTAVRAVSPLGNGNINTTYRVELADGEPFVLQRLNTTVFPQPRLVMANLLAVARHVEGRLRRERAEAGRGSGLGASTGSASASASSSGSGPDSGSALLSGLGLGSSSSWISEGRRWVFPQVLRSASGDPWLETDGDFWRAISFVPAATSLERLETPSQAWEVGYGLGRFHELLHDLPCDQLADTLEGFHITPRYLAAYHALRRGTGTGTGTGTGVTSENPAGASPPSTMSASCPPPSGDAAGEGADSQREAWAHAFVEQREALAGVLERAKAAGELPLRPIHGDPKVNNLLLDAASGQAVALVDLDTVKPGLVHYDIGDCLRSGCNPLGEETLTPEKVCFDLALCSALLEGYGAAARHVLTPADHHYLFDAIRLISFELGLRFFSDHLAGNVYFHTSRPGHNLDRALVQFHLTASIEAQEEEIRRLLARLREGS